MTYRANDSREGATIAVVANYFHAELSDPAQSAREELLSAVRLQQMASMQGMPKGFGDFYLLDDGVGSQTREVAKSNELSKSAPAARAREFDLIRF